MSTNKIEFIIRKDANKVDVKPESMSIEAAKAFSILLSSTANILALTLNSDDVEIKIKTGSLVLVAESTDDKIEEIEENFIQILNKKSTNKELVSEWRNIQNLFSQNGLTYEANIIRNNQVNSVLNDIKYSKQFRAKPTKSNYNTSIKFLNGTLLAVGGKSPNIHIESQDKKRLTINCSEKSAKKANKFLYDEIHISVWVRKVDEGVKYELCDSYWRDDPYADLEVFIEEFESAENEIKALKILHYKCREFLDKKDYTNFRKFIRLFIHESIDVNILKTILIITQPFKEHEKLKEMREDLKNLFNKKIDEYRRRRNRKKLV